MFSAVDLVGPTDLAPASIFSARVFSSAGPIESTKEVGATSIEHYSNPCAWANDWERAMGPIFTAAMVLRCERP